MRIEEKDLRGGSRLMDDYLYQYNRLQPFFQYHPFLVSSWQERIKWLSEHPIPHRALLAEGLMSYNKKVQNHPVALGHIDLLLDQETYVVIGGQQAGILTGPLYVIHKAITLIQLAKRMEAETGKRLVPVFWIASEDHDWDEVNHTFLSGWDEELKKIVLSPKPDKKLSIDQIEMESHAFYQLTREFFSWLPDSPYQHELKEKLLEIADQSNKLSDFFARIMAWLFGEHGLVLVDSADAFIRTLEKPVFSQLIHHDYSHLLVESEKALLAAGYHSQLDVSADQAHFFIHHDDERQLMMRTEETFSSKDGKVSFHADQLQNLVETDPTRFSSNVVSRPIMQESIFPVLAFVGGPGEIAYWALLKPLFHEFGFQMPIVYPRFTFTLVERKIEKYLEVFGLSYEDVLSGWSAKREAWLRDLFLPGKGEDVSEVKTQLTNIYLPFAEKLSKAEPGIQKLGEKNLERILNHVDFLWDKTYRIVEHRHATTVKQWDQLLHALYPLEKPQERVYNVFGYLNQYGTGWIQELIDQPFSLDASHKLVYI